MRQQIASTIMDTSDLGDMTKVEDIYYQVVVR